MNRISEIIQEDQGRGGLSRQLSLEAGTTYSQRGCCGELKPLAEVRPINSSSETNSMSQADPSSLHREDFSCSTEDKVRARI